MKCPNCGFNSFDYLEECKKCKLPLNPSPEYKSLYKGVRNTAQRGPAESNRSTVQRGANERLDRERPNLELDSEERVTDIYEKGSILDKESLDEVSREELYANKPEINPGPSKESFERDFPDDPSLYSESSGADEATNLAEDPEIVRQDEESYSIAGLKLRAAAFGIDVLIVGLITYLAIETGFNILEGESVKTEELSRVFLPIYALLFFLASTYFIFLHYYAGKTVGKMALGIRVISADGKEVGLWESFMRWVGYYISAVFLFAGFIWSIFDPDSQAWHDKIAGTYVVIG